MAFCQPKDYKNHATAATGVLHFPNCPSGPWYEFPLMADGHTLYDPPRAPGQGNPARVIFAYTSSTTAHFCGAITHAAAAGHGDFISCTWECGYMALSGDFLVLWNRIAGVMGSQNSLNEIEWKHPIRWSLLVSIKLPAVAITLVKPEACNSHTGRCHVILSPVVPF